MTASPAHAPDGWAITRSPIPWTPVSPGIWSFTLTPGVLLVRFAPDAEWDEEDVHAASPEELTILSGSLHLAIPGASDILLTTGDRVRAERSTRHRPKAGPDGCDLIAVYPLSRSAPAA